MCDFLVIVLRNWQITEIAESVSNTTEFSWVAIRQIPSRSVQLSKSFLARDTANAKQKMSLEPQSVKNAGPLQNSF